MIAAWLLGEHAPWLPHRGVKWATGADLRGLKLTRITMANKVIG